MVDRRRHRLRRHRVGRGPAVVHGQDVRLRLPLRLDARHAAARARRPADGLRLEVAAAGGAPEPVRHRRRDRDRQTRWEPSHEPGPRPRDRARDEPHPAQVLRAQGHVKYPEVRLDPPHKFRGRLQLLYDEYGTLKCETCFQCAQACPIECIDMGGMDTRGRYHVHWGAPETYGERREESALRRSGRPVPDPAYVPFEAVDIAKVDAVLEDLRPRPGPDARDPRSHPGRVWLPAGRGAQAHQPSNGCLVRDDLWHRQLLRPPPLRATRRDRPGRRGPGAPAGRGDLPRRVRCRASEGRA